MESEESEEGKEGKEGYLNAARGIAILMVVLVHQSQAVTKVIPLDGLTALIGAYGQMGVQLFFVASAITLCMSQSRRSGEPLRNFYIRRFFRIAPLYYFGIALYAAVHFMTTGEAGAYTVGNVLANLTFTHGFVPSAINDIVPGGWSIGGEMAFYVAFPFVFMAADAACRRWGAGVIAWSVAGLFAVYIAAWHIIPLVTPFAMARNNIFYYWPPAHVVVFGVGMAAYFMTRNGERPALWVDLSGFIVPTAVSLLLWNSGYPAAFAVIPGCSAVAFAFLINLLSRLRFDADRPSLIEMIGEASYSMYVLHFLVVWFAAPALIEAVASVMPSGAAVLWMTLPVTVALAFWPAQLTAWVIEGPGRRFSKEVIRRRPRTPLAA